MARAKFQVLVLPYLIRDRQPLYAIFCRSDMDVWQFIAGGGEDKETPLEAAKREASEEAAISTDAAYTPLDTCCSISASCFGEKNREHWGENCFVVPEYTFGVRMEREDFTLSHEHLRYKWLDYHSARKLLRYDSNKVALEELNERIQKGKLK